MESPDLISPKTLYRFKDSQTANRLIVVGDLHGDFESLERIQHHWNPATDLMLFIGDYADRGPQGVEVVECVDELIQAYPDRVIALCGNHERFSADGVPLFSPSHLAEEANERRGSWEVFFQTRYRDFLGRLYLTAAIPEQALFVHGGVSSKIKDWSSLENPDDDMIEDLLNADATDRFYDETFNRLRGKSVRFGKRITEALCKQLNVKKIFRGHQHGLAVRGPHFHHDDRLVTVISTNVYSKRPYILSLNPRDVTEMQKIDLRSGSSSKVVI